MSQILTFDEIKALADQKYQNAISIFFPSHLADGAIQQDQTRLKNLLRSASEKLSERKLTPEEVSKLLDPIEKLIDDIDFWTSKGKGFVILISENFEKHFKVSVEIEEKIYVDNKFHFKPLLPLYSDNGHFYLLAISQKHVSLFECTKFECNELHPVAMPKSLEEALGKETPIDNLQFHSSNTNGGTPIFYGGGSDNNQNEDQVKRFLNEVDKGLKGVLANTLDPLVLAAVDYYHPIYKEITNYQNSILKGLVVVQMISA
jgi:hypothetical protein